MPAPEEWQCPDSRCKMRHPADVSHRRVEGRPRCVVYREVWVRLDNGDVQGLIVVLDQGR